MNVAVALPTLITGIVCASTVVALLKRVRAWWVLGLAGAVGHVWAHLIPLSQGHRHATVGMLIGLFAVPVLWILLMASIGVLGRKQTVEAT